MPRTNTFHIGEGACALWRIDETAEMLRTMLHTHVYDAELARLTHEGRRAEWLAARVLLTEVLGEDKVIAYKDNGMPYLTDRSFHISISHSGGYVALAYHPSRMIGIDIERISSRVLRVADRFCNEAEMVSVPQDDALRYYLLNWSAKETLYKLCGTEAMADFRDSFQIEPYQMKSQGEVVAKILHSEGLRQRVCYEWMENMIATWAVSEDECPLK